MDDDCKTDRNRIDDDGQWCPCRLCEDAFRKQTLSLRYCEKCEQAFCEGVHGTFSFKVGRCVVCGARKDYKTRQKDAKELAVAKKAAAERAAKLGTSLDDLLDP